ncbi:hypothetical protein Tco_0241358 [Tanacetum coccineum]
MAERTMEELLRAPTEGYGEAIVLPEINADHFEIKTNCIQLFKLTRHGRALIDVYGEEITLRVDNEAVTFNLDQTTRYSSTNDKSVNRIDIIDAVCEEYAPEFLGFPNSSGGNPTPTSEPFTSEFILEEIEAYLKDDSISAGN